MQINTESLDQVNKAIRIIGRVHTAGGFLQHGMLQRLQLNEPGESSYVLGTMKGLKMKFEKARTELQAEETRKVSMYNSFASTKKAELASKRQEVTRINTRLQELQVDLVRSRRRLERATSETERESTLLEQTRRRCVRK